MIVRVVRRLLRRLLLIAVVALVAIIGVRIWTIESGPPLELWHTYVPHELSPAQMDASSFADYRKAEDGLLAEVRSAVVEKIAPADYKPTNRYFAGSPVNPDRFATNWNRSFELEPDGPVAGAAVFLHGLTDAPFSLRHLAELYRDRGFVAIGIRLPGHGTVPAGLTNVSWQDWMAAVRLAMREARAKAGPDKPVHLIGYSNGGALALLYVLDAIEDGSLTKPSRLVLLSPMIGVTRFARFAGLAGLPALLPAFAKAAWLDILPEFNPFKYNSFPVNAARQSYAVTREVQDRFARLQASGKLSALPPILTFQSILDSTVSTAAVIDQIYQRLPGNGSELVLFDINRHTALGLLFRPQSDTALERLLPEAPRDYKLTVVANRDPSTDEVVARVTEAGAKVETVVPTGDRWSPDAYSLSHVALPFPTEDGLYGGDPDPADNFGVKIGKISAHGERGALIVSLDWLLRMSWNPFFDLVRARVSEALPPAGVPQQQPPAAVAAPAAIP